MTFYYLDSSAWVKRCCLETGTQRVLELFAEENPIVCSQLGLPEVVATLARKKKNRQLSEADFATKIAEIENDWSLFTRINLDDATAELSKEAAVQWALRGADGVHFAAAGLLQKQLSPEDDMFLVTADTEMIAAALQSGIKVIDPNTT